MSSLLRLLVVAIALAALVCSPAASASGDPLPSWKETAAKKAIVTGPS
ncbi:MAG TPA: hypothetical protein VN903_33715 [Polyangia bacterium]|jgi:hypothetical protein|nr:hypothetical protein [Polyangia bacterium]